MKSMSVEDSRTPSRYATIRQVLRDAIVNGDVAEGLVLLEAPLAELFGTSRVPVRRALDLLHEEGLISRFNGRGYLVNPDGTHVEPLRLALTHHQLGLDSSEELVDTRPLGERIYEEIGAALSTCIAFGHYRLDEQIAAEHYGVSRAVVREALMRLRDRGLVEKEPYSQWLAGPLTAREVTEDYELRACLEPEALRQTAPGLSRDDLVAMLARVEAAQNNPQCSLADIERLEEDLHHHCLAGITNRKIATLIRQGQSPMIISRIFYSQLGIGPDDAMLAEHRLILELLLHGAFDAAALNLKEHLNRASQRMLQRLKVLSVLPEQPVPEYLTRLS
ncbi:GntR family transcriptional regulator [Pseudomonas sp. AK106]|uniref:GntR family transcriptional regulator n=2 Tax=Pseudomonas TaxID=286 RepID=A0A1C2E011_9PSED|nr:MULTISPECIES: GntR family transcriptional regulator [Pseudomonas]MBD8596411.1 GntR family transcriptional regulator [Pseudomonas sp. CFBP 8772]OCX20364.1 GntR family transcriptional regulator [Pseudomonas graminis]RZI70957.1 MAG: GntR family transcriptional regulator [Pseudomonas sp.]